MPHLPRAGAAVRAGARRRRKLRDPAVRPPAARGVQRRADRQDRAQGPALCAAAYHVPHMPNQVRAAHVDVLPHVGGRGGTESGGHSVALARGRQLPRTLLAAIHLSSAPSQPRRRPAACPSGPPSLGLCAPAHVLARSMLHHVRPAPQGARGRHRLCGRGGRGVGRRGAGRAAGAPGAVGGRGGAGAARLIRQQGGGGGAPHQVCHGPRRRGQGGLWGA